MVNKAKNREYDRAAEMLRAQLSGRSGKMTPQRMAVLRAVLETHDHFSVEELYLALQQKQAGISIASLYRALPLLVSAGVVREVRFGAGRARYEHSLGHKQHDHLVCLACGKVIEVGGGDLDRVQEQACRAHGFSAEGRSFVVRGYCRKCQGKR